ncbi:MAG: leucine-rich repeat domain-containing protein [Defluviitaleaceae bacterium]|nr:leucine-rich repeat domain-containing protein [Defluviitaleaceae bacterium]MCL2263594.1 leucine-rich repeat domain-containing protein [Defluviitaleaceae bacterium]
MKFEFMKKFVCTLVFSAVFLVCNAVVLYANDIRIEINGVDVKLDVSPIIQDGRVLVPLRAIAEALNMEVDWDSVASVVRLSEKTHATDVIETVEITEIELSGKNITDEKLLKMIARGEIPANVTSLNLANNNITDVSPLAALTDLTELRLWGNRFEDISPLYPLTNLRSFDTGDNVHFNGDLSVLIYFENLTTLGLSGGTWGIPFDLSPVGELTKLERFHLWGGSQFNDLSLFPDPENMTHLTLNGVNIKDFYPLKNFTNLVSLDLQHSEISDISVMYLDYLANLTELFLWGNQIVDVAPLRNLRGLELLALSGNLIVDVSPLSELTNLTWLSLSDNQISDISPLYTLKNLQQVDIHANPISDNAREVTQWQH